MTKTERAARYLSKIDSISGQGGDEAAFVAACALAEGFGFSEAEMWPLMREWNAGHAQPPWPESRLAHKIHEALRIAERSRKRGHLAGPEREETGTTFRVRREEPVVAESVSAFLEATFLPGEFISIGAGEWDDEGNDGKGGYVPPWGTTLTREVWIEKAKARGDSLAGAFASTRGFRDVWVRINPMMEGGGKNEHVTSYRHVLIEFDAGTEAAQRQKIVDSGAPVTAMIHSGGRSTHAWVRVDAANEAEWRAKKDELVAVFPDCDRQSLSPSRYSRLPGIERKGGRQRTLALNFGSHSWQEWKRPTTVVSSIAPTATPTGSDLPLPFCIDSLLDFKPEEDAKSVLGNRWLCEGGAALVIGQSGAGKSSLAAQMAVTWARGDALWGIKPRGPLRTLLIQAENDMGDIAEQFQGVLRGMLLDTASPEVRAVLRDKIMIVRESAKTGADFCKLAARLIEAHKPDLVIADPLLSYIGGELSKQEVCSSFLRNQLNPVLHATGACWIWCHHTNKPMKEVPKHWTDLDLSYLGGGSADLTNWARAVAVLIKTDKELPYYSFMLAKRGRRAGMVDGEGKSCTTQVIKHSETGISWERCLPEEKPRVAGVEDEKAGRYVGPSKLEERRKATAEAYVEILERLKQPQKYSEFEEIVKALTGYGRNEVRTKHIPALMKMGVTVTDDRPKRYVYEVPI